MAKPTDGAARSPDGLWWWDGKKWRPDREATSRHAQALAHWRQALIGPYDDQENQLEAALSLDPLFVDPLINLASKNIARENYDAAESLLRRVLLIDPKHVLARWMLAECFLDQELVDDAIPIYRDLLYEPGQELKRQMEWAKSLAFLYRQKADPSAGLGYMMAIDTSTAPPDDDIRTFMVARAVVAYQAGDEERALADLEWVESVWRDGSGVATLKARMVSGELGRILAGSGPSQGPSVTRCPVCGAPRRPPGAAVCHFCSTSY